MAAKACNFTKNNTPSWVFLTFFKLYKWYQIAQSILNMNAIYNYQIPEFYSGNETGVETMQEN